MEFILKSTKQNPSKTPTYSVQWSLVSIFIAQSSWIVMKLSLLQDSLRKGDYVWGLKLEKISYKVSPVPGYIN